MVLLFSSDYYTVYRQDILVISSLPDDYCYHFRYKEKYVSEDVKTRVSSNYNFDGAPALILFVSNNVDKTNSDVTLVPVRLAQVVRIIKEYQTDLYHFYFRLKAFVDVSEKDLANFSVDQIPQSMYVGWQVVAPSYKATTWAKTIAKLVNLPNIKAELFFHFRINSKNGDMILPKYDSTTFEPYFEIYEGKEYIIRMSIFDTTAKEKTDLNLIRSLVEGTDIKTNMGEMIQPGVDMDDRSYKITGLLLGDISSPVNVLRMASIKKSTGEESDQAYYSVRVMFNVIKDFNRLIRYFVRSVFVILGGGLITIDFSKYMQDSSLLPTMILIKCAGVLVAAWAVSSLFYDFNKK